MFSLNSFSHKPGHVTWIFLILHLILNFFLQDALTLKHRPPLHSTSILIPILLCTACVSLYYPSSWTLSLLITLSFISHHVRDGYRRGIWFWPFGSTPPIPYWLYLVLITLFPGVITLIIKIIVNRPNSHKTMNV